MSKEILESFTKLMVRDKGDLALMVMEQVADNCELQQKIDKAIKVLDNYQNNLYSRETRKTLDDDIERTLSILQG